MDVLKRVSFFLILQLFVMPICGQAGVFGSKYDNLVVLEKLVHSAKLQNVKVPLTLGLPSEQIEQSLNDIHLSDLWEALILDPSLSAEQIKSGNCPNLQAIYDAIYKSLSSNQNLLTKEQQAWLEKLASEDKFLMVRSTGAEDTTELVNAGGNESVAYVKPTREAVTNAIAQVIASYFSLKSFENRIKADDDVFKEMPPMPVIIQELVGEAVDGKGSTIPRAGVLFTNEPLYTGMEPFNVTKISASLGHNEGVVSNKVPTDTFYMERSNTQKAHLLFSSVIKDKAHRLVPEKQGNIYELVSRENPRDLAMQPALSQGQLISLFNTGRAIQQHYGRAMDVEFVFMGDTLYLVQARPVKRTPAHPSYIDPQAFTAAPSPIQATFKFSSIVPGSSSVLVITNKNQLLIDRTIDTAEQKYDKDVTQFIVVETPASANSHPAVNLASNGVPCVYMSPKEAAQLRAALQNVSEKTPLVVDTQRESIYQWNAHELLPPIKNGWYSHPIPLRLSLALKNPEKYAQPAVIKKLDSALQMLLDSIKFAAESDARVSLDALKKMFMGSTNAVKIKLLVFAKRGQVYKGRNLINIINQMQKYFKLLEPSLRESITQSSGSLQRLYPIKLLEALINQIPFEDENILGAYSLRYFGYTLVSSLLAHDYQTKLAQQGITNPVFTSYALFADFGATTQTEKAWTNFLISLEIAYEDKDISSEEVEKFKQLLDTLKSLDALTVWLETSFRQSDEAGATLMWSLIAQFDTRTEDFVRELQVRRTELHRLKESLGLFAERRTFDAAFDQLARQAEYFAGPFITKYQKSSALGRLIALQVMNYFGDVVYDKAIKAMLASSDFDDATKAEKLHAMLKPLFVVFKAWATKLMPEKAIRYNLGWSLTDYLYTLEKLVMESYVYDASQLSLENFDVRGALLGSATAFSRHLPSTLAHVFTLIHQNVLTVLSVLSAQTELSSIKLSEQESELVEYLSALKFKVPGIGKLHSSLVGIELTSENVKFLFNVPLRDHGLTYQIILTKNKPIRLAVQLLGHNEGDRWRKIKLFINAIAGPLDVTVKDLYLPERAMTRGNAGEVSFELQFSEDAPLDTIKKIVSSVLGVSIDISFNERSLVRSLRYIFTPLFGKKLTREIEDALIQQVIAKLFGQKFLEETRGKGAEYEQAVQVAQGAIYNWNWNLYAASYRQLEQLEEAVGRGQQYALATIVVQKAIKGSEPWIDSSVLKLLGKLVDQGQQYDLATIAVQKAIKDSEGIGAQIAGFELLGKLVDQGQQYDLATQGAKVAIKSSDYHVRAVGLKLLGSLVDQGQQYALAVESTKKAFNDSDYPVREAGLKLLGELVGQGQQLALALEVAQELLKGSDEYAGLELLGKLVDQGQQYELATAAVQEAIKDAGHMQSAGLELLGKLVGQGQQYKLATTAAQEAIEDSCCAQEAGLKLLGSLVNQGQQYELATAAAQKAIKDSDYSVQEAGLKLLGSLVGRGQQYALATTAARKAIKSSEPYLQYLQRVGLPYLQGAVIELLGLPVDVQQFGDQQFGDHRYRDVQREGLKLLGKLVEQGQQYELATEVAQKIMKGSDEYLRDAAHTLQEQVDAASNKGLDKSDPKAVIRERQPSIA